MPGGGNVATIDGEMRNADAPEASLRVVDLARLVARRDPELAAAYGSAKRTGWYKETPSNEAKKTTLGNFFRRLLIGQTIVPAAPRTITEATWRWHTALTGFSLRSPSADTFAHFLLGLPRYAVDDLLAFHRWSLAGPLRTFSLNAVANLGYGRSLWSPVSGDTLNARFHR